MKELSEQEKLPEIQNLRTILQQYNPTEEKSEEQWSDIQSSLFSKMDALDQENENSPNSNIRSFPIFSKFAIAAVLICAVLLGVWTIEEQEFLFHKPLSGAFVVSQTGYSKIGDKKKIDQNDVLLHNKQFFETGSKSSLVVKLDKYSSIVLSENTRVEVTVAHTQEISLLLVRGTLSASIGKREVDQTFFVRTPKAECQIIGTVFKVSHANDISMLSVYEGNVAFRSRTNKNIHYTKTGETASLLTNQEIVKSKTPSTVFPKREVKLLTSLPYIRKDSEKSRIITFTSEPKGARVYVNNTLIGVTPVMIPVQSSEISLKLEKVGYETLSKELSLSGDRIGEQSFTLEIEKKDFVKKHKRKIVKDRTKQGKGTVVKRDRKDIKKEARKVNLASIENSNFVQALIHITVGEYTKAITILDSIKNLPEVTIPEKVRIMKKIAQCYKGMGQYDKTIKTLTEKYENARSHNEKGHLLWEIITVKTNCLEDYVGAEKDIQRYIKEYPDGVWLESVYCKHADIHFAQANYKKSITIFEEYLKKFKKGNFKDYAVHNIATTYKTIYKNYKAAEKWYSILIKDFQKSDYFDNALVERADTFYQRGLYKKAEADYQRYLKINPDGYLRVICESRLSDLKRL